MEENQRRNKMAGGIAVSKYLYSNILDCGKIGREKRILRERRKWEERKLVQATGVAVSKY